MKGSLWVSIRGPRLRALAKIKWNPTDSSLCYLNSVLLEFRRRRRGNEVGFGAGF
jgi:hypothetical protein